MPATALDTFAPFSVVHAGAVVAVATTAIVMGRWRRRLGDGAAGRRSDWRVAAVGLAIWAAVQIAEVVRFRVDFSIPIHICDVVSFVAPFAVWSRRSRLARAVLYYWGLGLSTQAVFQPELAGGPATLEFWVFWLPHGAVVVLAVYDVVGRGFRPGWRDYRVVLGTLALYVAVVLPVDLALDVNYGFVGRSDGGPLDFLGPWPVRVYKAATAVVVALAVMTVPWTAAARRRERAAPVVAATAVPPPATVGGAGVAEANWRGPPLAATNQDQP